jgi:hypothetical protein
MTLDQMLRAYVSAALAPFGFSKTGRTYRQVNKHDDQALINFQVSQASGPGYNVFFVNIAIVPRTQHEVLARHYGWSASVRPSIVEGIVHDRVWPHPDVEHDNRSEFRDQRWEFTDDASAEKCGGLLAEVLATDIAPALSTLVDRRALLEYLEQPGSTTRWRADRLPRNSVVLLIDGGPSAELTAAIAQAAAVGDTNTVEWAEERLRSNTEMDGAPDR